MRRKSIVVASVCAVAILGSVLTVAWALTQEKLDADQQRVADYLDENLVDPDSLEFVKWMGTVESDYDGRLIRVKYRADGEITDVIFCLEDSEPSPLPRFGYYRGYYMNWDSMR